MFRSILVATDGSKHAMKAAVAGIDLAKRYGSKLQFLIVTKRLPARVSDSLRRYMEVEHMLGEPEDIVEDMAKEVLGKAMRHARKKGLRSVKSTTLSGQPARAIVDFAKRNKVDLIVMGSRGLGDIKGVLMGSVSHKVSSLAGCTCMTVR